MSTTSILLELFFNKNTKERHLCEVYSAAVSEAITRIAHEYLLSKGYELTLTNEGVDVYYHFGEALTPIVAIQACGKIVIYARANNDNRVCGGYIENVSSKVDDIIAMVKLKDLKGYSTMVGEFARIDNHLEMMRYYTQWHCKRHIETNQEYPCLVKMQPDYNPEAFESYPTILSLTFMKNATANLSKSPD